MHIGFTATWKRLACVPWDVHYVTFIAFSHDAAAAARKLLKGCGCLHELVDESAQKQLVGVNCQRVVRCSWVSSDGKMLPEL